MKIFFDYFDKRHREAILRQPVSEDGPVITISRQTGCDARQVAETVADQLNRKYGTTKWKWIDKDIIYRIAREIDTDSERIEGFYKGIEHSNLSEMIMAFSGTFVSDQRIKRAIEDVVLSICKEGYIVIVGRGGVSIAQQMIDSLHIRLMAPFYWRVENVMKKKGMNIEEAEEFVVDTDEKRFKLIQTFLKQKSINIDYLFDATINRSGFTIQQTASLIVSMYDSKVCCQMEQRKKNKPLC
ncbi:MAG: cytidylate kinase-like family protein [Bacteroidales bacterium]|nr:cytidylate kinase-like family protein [Bacteroidales bacterium]